MTGIRLITISYLLTISSLIGIGGMIGDRYGRKIIFQSGMGLFVIGSISCALSPSLEVLILSRILQAMGASGLMANGLGLVITYIDPLKRGRAIGLNSLVVASALSVGPVLGGFLSEFIGWESIFLINIPIGFCGIILVQRFIPETPKKPIKNLDFRGMLLFIVVIFSFVGGILSLFAGDILGLLLIIGSLIGGILFIFIETSHPEPMISIRLMKNKTILTGIISSLLCYMAYYGLVFLLPFFFQEVWLFKQSLTGVLMIVAPIIMGISAPFGGFFADKIDPRKQATFGAVFLGGFILLFGFFIDLSLIVIMPLIALSAGSLVIFTSSNGTSVMNASPKDDVSIISGMIGLSRNIGFALATTFSSALFGVFFEIYNPNNITSGTVFVSSYHQSLESTFIIFAFFAFLGALISALRDPKDKKLKTGNVRA
jgi:EmrB/QacA subfamily drug resistance transporter